MTELIKGSEYEYLYSRDQSTLICKYFFDVTVYQFCEPETSYRKERTYNFINFSRSKEEYEEIINDNIYCEKFNKIFHKLIIKYKNGDICDTNGLIIGIEYCIDDESYTFVKRIDNCKLFITLSITDCDSDAKVVVFNPEIVESRRVSYGREGDNDTYILYLFTSVILTSTLNISMYPIVTREQLNADRLDERILDSYYASLYDKSPRDLIYLSGLIFSGKTFSLSRSVETNKCVYNFKSNYSELLSRFYRDTTNIPKIEGDYFYLYRTITESICFQRKNYSIENRNIVIHLQPISCSYSMRFIFDEWAYGANIIFFKIRVPTRSNYLMNHDRRQEEITLAPGLFIIRRISRIIWKGTEQIVYEVDYEQFDESRTNGYISDIDFIQESEYTGDPVLLLEIPFPNQLVDFREKYLKYKQKYMKLKSKNK